MKLWPLSALPLLLLASSAPPPSRADDPPKVVLELYPEYQPSPGRLIVISYLGKKKDVHVARDVSAYRDLDKAFTADDEVGLREMREDGRLLSVASGTPALVLDVRESPALGEHTALEVRFRAGPLKDKKAWVMAAFTGRPMGPREQKAKALLDAAWELEKSGTREQAIAGYREVVSKYPGTPQAKTAAFRIDAFASRDDDD